MVNAHKSSILINVDFYFYFYLFSLVFNSLSKNTNIFIHPEQLSFSKAFLLPFPVRFVIIVLLKKVKLPQIDSVLYCSTFFGGSQRFFVLFFVELTY